MSGALGGSPAVAVLRALLHPRAEPGVLARLADRLASGGVVREIARRDDLRRCLPLLGDAVSRAGLLDALPPDERGCLLAARLAAEARADRVRRTLAPLGAACARHGVAPLLLKGLALHGDLYPDPALRAVSDADVFVPPASFALLRQAVEESGLLPDPMTVARLLAYDASGGREARLSDFVFAAPPDGPLPSGVPVEAKLDPVQLGLPLRAGERFAVGARRSAAYAGFVVPAAEPMAVQQALHLARHDGADLLWFSEIAAVVARAAARLEFDPRLAFALVEGEGLGGTLAAVFRATEDLFPGALPPALLRATGRRGLTPARFRARPTRPTACDETAATWSLQVAHAVSAGRPAALLAALWRRLAPHPAYVAARMGLPPGSRPGLAARLRRLGGVLRLRDGPPRDGSHR